MLLLDSSGSMLRKPNCACTTPPCEECLPNCNASEQDRWTRIVGATTGSFASFGCTTVTRTAEAGATYDVGYPFPWHRINAASVQRPDGILDTYATRVRFGLASFDGLDTYFGANPLISAVDFDKTLSVQAPGMFSYGGWASDGSPRRRPDGSLVGEFQFPHDTELRMMDTGIRSASAPEGALVVTHTLEEMRTRAAAMQKSILDTRPYGGTPIAAALDDLYALFTQDQNGFAGAARDAKRYIVLVTDGVPDSDYRDYACDCMTTAECGGDPAQFSCPYPTPEDAALHLRCGFGGASQCAGPVDKVYVIGLNTSDAAVRTQLDKIAAAGGSKQGRYTEDPIQLRDALNAVLDETLTESKSP